MGRFKTGIYYAVNEYMKVRPENKVVIITDKKSEEIAECIRVEARKIAPDIDFFVMEHYCTGKRKKFPDIIKDSFTDERKKVVSFYLSSIKPSQTGFELLSLGDPISDYIDKEKPTHIKHACLNGITRKIVKQSFCVKPSLLKRYTESVYQRVKHAKTIEIYSPEGTDLEIKVDSSNIGWMKEDSIRYGCWENMPLGEVYSAPIDCNGKLVADSIIGTYDHLYGFKYMKKHPLKFKIKNGEVKSVSCRRPSYMIDPIKKDIKIDKTAGDIGEIGFGTNFSLKKLIGNMLHDEKFPGVHIGIGSAMPDCGKKRRSDNHLDVMMLEPSVYVDGVILIKEGNYVGLDHLYGDG